MERGGGTQVRVMSGKTGREVKEVMRQMQDRCGGKQTGEKHKETGWKERKDATKTQKTHETEMKEDINDKTVTGSLC